MNEPRVDSYQGVSTRALYQSEQRISASDGQTPLVIEPTGSNQAQFLEQFFKLNSHRLLKDIAKHNAVLIRGFDVHSVAEFERLVLSIRGMEGMRDVLMSEAGRTVVSGTSFVLHTNTLYKTGGTLDFGGFHVENYYVADVPRYISFFCIRPSRMGGETGLLNTARLYSDLPESLRNKLESRAFWVSGIPISSVATRYGCSPEVIEDFCENVGLSMITHTDMRALVIYKPSVLVHPVTRESALAINLTAELSAFGFQKALISSFLPDYAGLRWAIHRLNWRYPALFYCGKAIRMLVSRPRIGWSMFRQIYGALFSTQARASQLKPIDMRVGDILSKEEIDILARSVRKNYSSFLWRRGDILIVDNLKTAHAGMPGFGERELKALICNRVDLPLVAGSGVFVPSEQSRKCLGERLAMSCKREEITGQGLGPNH